MLFKDYIVYWHQTYRKPKQARSTALVIENTIRVHIANSKLGNTKVKDITVRDCQEFLTDLLVRGNKSKLNKKKSYGKPLAKSSVNKIRQLLIASLRQAQKEQIILSNPAEYTEPISINKEMSNFFSHDTQKRFLEYTKNHRFFVAYQLLFFTGCRRGEILGLSWNNVDLRKNYIYIRQTLGIEDGQIVLYRRHAKTPKSIRIIPIPFELKKSLIKIRERQKEEKECFPLWNNPDDLIFTNRDGSPHNPNYFTRNFKNVIRRMGLPEDLHLHCTRHSWATNLVQLGIPISDIQALGGWSRPDVLLNIYSHTLQQSQKKAINKLWKSMNL